MKLTELFSNLANAVRKIKNSTTKMTPEKCVEQLERIGYYDGSNNLEAPAEKEQSYLVELIEGTLEEVHDDSVTFIGDHSFILCSSLTNVTFPNCTSIGYSAFANCVSLQEVSFPNCTSIGYSAFAKCSSLESVYLNVSSVPGLQNKNAFYSTPLSRLNYLGYYGSIYVPSSLYEAFCSATNWVTYSQRIVSYDFEGGNK